MKHDNSGYCLMCHTIINRYPGFNENLRSWFTEFQKKHPEMHTSCAGRGRIDQEAYFARGSSRARWSQSSHNYNCAIDLFVTDPKNPTTIYPKEWFSKVLSPNLPKWICWYGEPGSRFFEMPHCEIRGWQELVKQGIIKLVEDVSGSHVS